VLPAALDFSGSKPAARNFSRALGFNIGRHLVKAVGVREQWAGVALETAALHKKEVVHG
jgi:hypothetical protein